MKSQPVLPQRATSVGSMAIQRLILPLESIGKSGHHIDVPGLCRIRPFLHWLLHTEELALHLTEQHNVGGSGGVGEPTPRA